MTFDVIVSNFEENLDKAKYAPEQYVQETAKGKALSVYVSDVVVIIPYKFQRENTDVDLIIACDSVVVKSGRCQTNLCGGS